MARTTRVGGKWPSRGRTGPLVAWAGGLGGLVGLTLLVGWPDSHAAPLAAVLLDDAWLLTARASLLAAWVGVVLWGGWRLTRPGPAWARWLIRGILLLLLAGILMPPDLMRLAVRLLSDLLTLDDSRRTAELDLQMVGHFGLFSLLAGPLFFTRADLGALPLLGALGALALSTELMQLFIGGRTMDPLDVLTDLVGVGFGALAVLAGSLLWSWLGLGAASTPAILPSRCPDDRPYNEIRAAPSLPRPLEEGWGEGTIGGEATCHGPGWLGSPHDR